MKVGSWRHLSPLPPQAQQRSSWARQNKEDEPNPGPEPGGPGWRPYAAAAVLALGWAAGQLQSNALQLAPITPLSMQQGKLAYLPPTQIFLKPQDWSKQDLVLKVKVPHPKLVSWVSVKDDQGHSQRTRWTEGQNDPHNLHYDATQNILTLRYGATHEEVDIQGHTDAGFDPTRIRQVQFGVSNNGAKDSLVGSLHRLGKAIV